ncbi:MAG: glycine cleavage system aminomethyltransferase GcvT [Acidimicrobiales bacterium]
MSDPPVSLRRTPLFDLHRERNGRMVDFAGWSLPVRFDPGPVAEHFHTREAASLFDVSHMAVVEVHGASLGDAAIALESLVPADVVGLSPGRQRYTMITNASGGVVDDLMIATTGDYLTLVLNASRREVDLEVLRSSLEPNGIEVIERSDLALLAVQGPEAVRAVAALAPGVEALGFMDIGVFEVAGVDCRVSRSGYTGEDGLELHVPGDEATAVARGLLAGPGGVELAGLAARDSLRLEAGLCLYGNDLDETTTPVEAGLTWTIPGRRRSEGGFPGADVVHAQLDDGPPRLRVGLRIDGRRPVRAGAEVADPETGEVVGRVTSGGYGPTFGGPIAMGYVPPSLARPDVALVAVERGKESSMLVTELPFVTRRYHRPSSAQIFQEGR